MKLLGMLASIFVGTSLAIANNGIWAYLFLEKNEEIQSQVELKQNINRDALILLALSQPDKSIKTCTDLKRTIYAIDHFPSFRERGEFGFAYGFLEFECEKDTDIIKKVSTQCAPEYWGVCS